ncbi:hypothetical protein NMY22_g16631 [Coprinellus aureogranulatus]|nr:hypothetical protein NMY22_g16631 [Coprinellus aureogranulatus]
MAGKRPSDKPDEAGMHASSISEKSSDTEGGATRHHPSQLIPAPEEDPGLGLDVSFRPELGDPPTRVGERRTAFALDHHDGGQPPLFPLRSSLLLGDSGRCTGLYGGYLKAQRSTLSLPYWSGRSNGSFALQFQDCAGEMGYGVMDGFVVVDVVYPWGVESSKGLLDSQQNDIRYHCVVGFYQSNRIQAISARLKLLLSTAIHSFSQPRSTVLQLQPTEYTSPSLDEVLQPNDCNTNVVAPGLSVLYPDLAVQAGSPYVEGSTARRHDSSFSRVEVEAQKNQLLCLVTRKLHRLRSVIEWGARAKPPSWNLLDNKDSYPTRRRSGQHFPSQARSESGTVFGGLKTKATEKAPSLVSFIYRPFGLGRGEHAVSALYPLPRLSTTTVHAMAGTTSNFNAGYNSGTISQVNNHNHNTLNVSSVNGHVEIQVGASDRALKELYEHIAPGAMHNSAARYDAPKCHPETRKAVKENIFGWISDRDEGGGPQQLLWLTGPAGAGKTAIMGTIADELEQRGSWSLRSTSRPTLVRSRLSQRAGLSRRWHTSFTGIGLSTP